MKSLKPVVKALSKETVGITSLEYGFLQSDGVSVTQWLNFQPILFCGERADMAWAVAWTVDEMLSPLDETAWAETLPSE